MTDRLGRGKAANNAEKARRELRIALSSPVSQGLHEALEQALRQWKSYAEMHESDDGNGRDITTEKSVEGDLYRAGLAALASLGPAPAKADDEWVLAEGHKLPEDLGPGDEIRELYRIEPKTDASDYGKLVSVTYRRRSQEHAGGEVE